MNLDLGFQANSKVFSSEHKKAKVTLKDQQLPKYGSGSQNDCPPDLLLQYVALQQVVDFNLLPQTQVLQEGSGALAFVIEVQWNHIWLIHSFTAAFI